MVVVAQQEKALLLTWNHKDFIKRGNQGESLYPDVHLLTFRCGEVNGIARLTEHVELVEFMFAKAVRDGKFFQATITETAMKVLG